MEFDRNNNSIAWSWDSFDYLSTGDYDQTVFDLGEVPMDWTHSNAATYNPADNSIYLSVRHLNRIVRIDYATGSIVYTMGFDMQDTQSDFGDNLFSFQHAPELLPNGNMVLFDNGNRRDHIVQSNATGVSKAIELQFTGSPPTSAAIVWQWTLPTYQRAKGDADRLANGNTLVTGAISDVFHEVDASGVELWRVDLIPTTQSFLTYRAERIDALLVDVPGDTDGDGHADYADNCPDHANPSQDDYDSDGFGDVCAAALGFPVPEPGSTILLFAGGAGLALLSRKRASLR